MSAMDDFNKLSAIRKNLAAYEWSFSAPVCQSIRLFSESSGRTTEQYLGDETKRLIEAMVSVTEYCGASISWSFYTQIGNAIKREILGKLDQRIREAAEKAKDEASEVLKVLAKEQR